MIQKTWVLLHMPDVRAPLQIACHGRDAQGNVVPMTDAQIADAIAKAREQAVEGSRIEIHTASYEDDDVEVSEASKWVDV